MNQTDIDACRDVIRRKLERALVSRQRRPRVAAAIVSQTQLDVRLRTARRRPRRTLEQNQRPIAIPRLAAQPGEAEQRRQVIRRECERQLETIGSILEMAEFTVYLSLADERLDVIVSRRHGTLEAWEGHRAP